MKNKKVLITCGPTWTPIDEMRVISNRSTGELGQKLALDLLKKGAKVTLLEGPVKKPLISRKIKIIKYQFFDELKALLRKILQDKFDIIVHAAAVSDYQLAKPYSGKIHSQKSKLILTLKPTMKLINQIKKWAPKTFLVGFKLEPSSRHKVLIDKASALCQKAHCDLVIGNIIDKGYKGYIIDNDRNVLAKVQTKSELIKNLIKVLDIN